MALSPLLFVIGLVAIAGATLSLIFVFLAHARAPALTDPHAAPSASPLFVRFRSSGCEP